MGFEGKYVKISRGVKSQKAFRCVKTGNMFLRYYVYVYVCVGVYMHCKYVCTDVDTL